MKTLVLRTYMQCTRNLSQKVGKVHPDYVDKNPLSISFATLEQVSFTMTGRHEFGQMRRIRDCGGVWWLYLLQGCDEGLQPLQR